MGSENTTILFRSHGSSTIGLGHIYRSITVASCLRDVFGFHARFMVNNEPHVHTLLEQFGFPFLSVDERIPLKQQLNGFLTHGRTGKKLLCYIDMKTNVSDEISVWKNHGARVILLDNLTPARLLADVNIFPFPGFNPSKFKWEGFSGRIYSGAEWIPVAEKFLIQRTTLPSFEQRNTILVAMGGADPNHLTIKIMNALVDLNDILIHIILGRASQCKEEASALNKKLGEKYTIIENTDRMESFMKEAGLALTAMGTTIYELATLGVPTVILSNYREDQEDEQELHKLGWTLPLGYYAKITEDKIRDSVYELWKDLNERKIMSDAALASLQGTGARRISEEIVNLSRSS